MQPDGAERRLAAILCAATIVTGASPAPCVDTVFLGGDILTMDEARSRVDALAVDGGRIVALGSEEEIRKLAGWRTRTVDLEGGTLMPGLIEPHCHPIATAMLGRALDVSGFTHGSRASGVPPGTKRPQRSARMPTGPAKAQARWVTSSESFALLRIEQLELGFRHGGFLQSVVVSYNTRRGCEFFEYACGTP